MLYEWMLGRDTQVRLVELPSGHNPVRVSGVACGGSHALFLTGITSTLCLLLSLEQRARVFHHIDGGADGGKVFSCGENRYGQVRAAFLLLDTGFFSSVASRRQLTHMAGSAGSVKQGR